MRGRDWHEKVRYLIHFDDGGTGPCFVDEQLDVGDELRDGGQRYAVERVEQPTTPFTLGSAWVRRLD
jgi:hypothetical protein